MKCHAGVEFKSGSPCPECGAKLGDVCWPGINRDLQEVQSLRTAALDSEKQMAALRRDLARAKSDIKALKWALENAASRFNLMGGVGLVNGACPKTGYSEAMAALRSLSQATEARGDNG